MHNHTPQTITLAARRLAYQHNSDHSLISGCIYIVDLVEGRIGGLVATYAANQIGPSDERFGNYALLRIGHGRMRLDEAQRFIDDLGQGW